MRRWTAFPVLSKKMSVGTTWILCSAGRPLNLDTSMMRISAWVIKGSKDVSGVDLGVEARSGNRETAAFFGEANVFLPGHGARGTGPSAAPQRKILTEGMNGQRAENDLRGEAPAAAKRCFLPAVQRGGEGRGG
jgi:hypothetical protein